MMVEAKNYKGIQYIQVNELPQVQQESLTRTINKDLFIKILIDGKVISDCLQYKDYTFWFNTVYRSTQLDVPATQDAEQVQFQAKLAFK